MSNKSEMTILRYDEIDDWDQFVERHPKGTVFHTSAMIRAFATTKRHTPFAYAAFDQHSNVCAMLVACRISTLGAWAAGFASRSVFYAEPIYDDTQEGQAGIRRLLSMHDQHMCRRTLFAEVRPCFSPPTESDPLLEQNYKLLGYLNFELDLRNSEEVLFNGFDRKCRNNIRSAMSRGVTVVEADPQQHLAEFVSVVAESYAGSKVPLADKSLFKSVFRELPSPISRLFLASYDGKVAAAAAFLAYKNRVYYWYAGARRIPGIPAMACIVWEAIKRYAQDGFELFDFAGGGWKGEEYGPGRFKAKFGGVVTDYGRYRRIYSPLSLRCAELAYQSVRGLISPTPKKCEQ